MKIEEKENILSASDKNYVIVRDEDWEILCMISREDWGYSAYTLEQYVLLKEDVFKILDKAAGLELIEKVDTDVANQYKDEAMIEKYLEKTEE